MTIEAVINKAIAEFRASGQQLTPDEFKKLFCSELKKAKLTHVDCEKVAKYSERFNENYKKLIKSYGVKDENDLFQFMLSQINRLNPAETEAYLASQMDLILKILKAVSLLKNKDASILATTSIDKITNTKNLEALATLKSKWDEFYYSYSDDFLEPLRKYCKVRKNTFEQIVEDVSVCFEKLEFSTVELSHLFGDTLKPSIAKSMDAELQKFVSTLLANPSLIKLRKTQNDIKALVEKRVLLDNQEVKNRLSEIDKIVDQFSKKLLAISQNSNSGSKKIGMIRSFISEMKLPDNSFDGVKQKLLGLVEALDVEMKEISDNSKEVSNVKALKQQIADLEKQLVSVKEEASIDSLTKLSNRKYLDEELSKIEEFYSRFGDTYSIVFFDIDNFKAVNDKFGHLAGDTVLASFALILKKYSRDIDIIGRWGGEEFIAILLKDSLDEAVNFANKIRESVVNTKFIYKDVRIPVTISAGAANRREMKVLRDVIKLSDDRLYKAKHGGRNRVEPVIA